MTAILTAALKLQMFPIISWRQQEGILSGKRIIGAWAVAEY